MENWTKKMLCDSHEGCKICDSIEDYYKNYLKNNTTDEDSALDIAKRIIVAEVELIREHKELGHKYESEFSTEEMLIEALNKEPKQLIHYVEGLAMDIFDYERHNLTEQGYKEGFEA